MRKLTFSFSFVFYLYYVSLLVILKRYKRRAVLKCENRFIFGKTCCWVVYMYLHNYFGFSSAMCQMDEYMIVSMSI